MEKTTGGVALEIYSAKLVCLGRVFWYFEGLVGVWVTLWIFSKRRSQVKMSPKKGKEEAQNRFGPFWDCIYLDLRIPCRASGKV